MSVQITIIGLGQVGSSIGLALAGQKNIKRVGHDKDYEVARAAQKAGAVDETRINLPASVTEANVVILSLPFNEIRETLKYIAQDLREGTVILDTAPAKGKVASWIEELIPPGRHYIGLSPAAGADYLHGNDLGVQSARADFFTKGLFLLNSPSNTPGEAVKLAADLVELLGAQVVFTDSVEADGLMAFTHVLPQLIGAALLDATVSQPGWTEARKVAARPYATATAAFVYHDEAKALGESALASRENSLRALDAYMASLQKMRDHIAAGEGVALTGFLEDALKARDRWFHDRTRADWNAVPQKDGDAVSFGEKMNQMFLGGLFSRNKKRT